MSFLKKLNRLNTLFSKGKRGYTPGQVLFIQSVEVAKNGDSVDNTDWVTTTSDITIPKQKVDMCSKILIHHTGACRINQATYTFCQWKIERTAPSAAESDFFSTGTANANDCPEVYHSTTWSWMDDSLVYGSDHTYRMAFRNYGANDAYSGVVYYREGGTAMHCIGLA